MKKIVQKMFLIIVLLNLTNYIYSNMLDQEAKTTEPTIQVVEKNIVEKDVSKKQTFSQEELQGVIQTTLEKASEHVEGKQTQQEKAKASAKAAAEILEKKLSQYQITGFSTAFDPNFAFFLDWQNPEFEVMFKNDKGETKFRTLRADIFSLGLKIEFALKFNLIFFINTNLTYIDTNKKIELGTGIDLRRGILDITYAPFKKYEGGLLILGIPIIPLFSGISVVLNGSITPIDQQKTKSI